jgi:hypothetical protein
LGGARKIFMGFILHVAEEASSKARDGLQSRWSGSNRQVYRFDQTLLLLLIGRPYQRFFSLLEGPKSRRSHFFWPKKKDQGMDSGQKLQRGFVSRSSSSRSFPDDSNQASRRFAQTDRVATDDAELSPGTALDFFPASASAFDKRTLQPLAESSTRGISSPLGSSARGIFGHQNLRLGGIWPPADWLVTEAASRRIDRWVWKPRRLSEEGIEQESWLISIFKGKRSWCPSEKYDQIIFVFFFTNDRRKICPFIYLLKWMDKSLWKNMPFIYLFRINR